MICNNCKARSTEERAEPLIDLEKEELTRQFWCPKCEYVTFVTFRIQRKIIRVTSEKL